MVVAQIIGKPLSKQRRVVLGLMMQRHVKRLEVDLRRPGCPGEASQHHRSWCGATGGNDPLKCCALPLRRIVQSRISLSNSHQAREHRIRHSPQNFEFLGIVCHRNNFKFDGAFKTLTFRGRRNSRVTSTSCDFGKLQQVWTKTSPPCRIHLLLYTRNSFLHYTQVLRARDRRVNSSPLHNSIRPITA